MICFYISFGSCFSFTVVIERGEQDLGDIFIIMWKDIIGYEWLYQVSYSWEVKSLNYSRTWKERILNPVRKQCWHSHIELYRYKVWRTAIISRLVGIHFIPNPLNLPFVLHKDETLDEKGFLYNWADNLFWWTQKENMQDMWNKWRANNNLQLRNPKPYLWKFGKEHNCSKTVIQYSLDWEFIKEWWSTREVERELWIHNWSISKCCRWKAKTAGGFIWKYL